MKARDRLIEIEVTLVHETEKAWLIESDVGAARVRRLYPDVLLELANR